MVDAAYEVGEGQHVLGKGMQGRVVEVAVVVAAVQELHDASYGIKRAAQVEYLVLLQMGSIYAYALDGCAHVEEVLKWKIVSLLLHTAKLACLSQRRIDKLGIVAKSHGVHLVLAQLAKTIALQQRAYFAKLYLAFKIAWINHAAKLINFIQTNHLIKCTYLSNDGEKGKNKDFIKKSSQKFCRLNKKRYLCTRN